MIRRISIVGLAVALVTSLLPAQVFAEDSRPLASLRTSVGLTQALQTANVVNAQDPTRRVPSGVQVQRQTSSVFASTPAKVLLVAAIAAGIFVAAKTWNGPEPTRADAR